MWKRERESKQAHMILQPTESHYALSNREIKIHYLVKRNLSQLVLEFLGKCFSSFYSTDVLNTCWGLTLHCTRSCTNHTAMAYHQQIHGLLNHLELRIYFCYFFFNSIKMSIRKWNKSKILLRIFIYQKSNSPPKLNARRNDETWGKKVIAHKAER